MDAFPIPLHPEVKDHLLTLYKELEHDNLPTLTLKNMIHCGVWLLLSRPSTEFLQDDKMCPFTRFVIAAHLMDHGQFARAHAITPLLARVQWCLRASTIQELFLILDDFDSDAEK